MNKLADTDWKDKAMFRPGVDIAITLNCNDRNQYFNYSTCYRTRYAVRTYYNIGRLLSNVSTWSLQPEMGINSGRLHYHGIINFNNNIDVYEFYCHIVPLLKDVCFIKLKEIDDPKKWSKYCDKDKGLMEECLAFWNLPYRLSNNMRIEKWDTTTIRIRPPKNKKVDDNEETFRRTILDFIETTDETNIPDEY